MRRFVRRNVLFSGIIVVVFSLAAVLLVWAFEQTQDVNFLERTGAAAYHRQNYTGAGVTIGVIDMGFAGDLSLLTQRELYGEPLKDPNNESDHGYAMMRIIHDIAPEAVLIPCRYSTITGFYNCITYMIGESVTLINHSAGIPIAQTRPNHPWTLYVEDQLRKLDNPPLWINAAGNFGNACQNVPIGELNANGYLNVLGLGMSPAFPMKSIDVPSTIFVTSGNEDLKISLQVMPDNGNWMFSESLGDGNFTERVIAPPKITEVTIKIQILSTLPSERTTIHLCIENMKTPNGVSLPMAPANSFEVLTVGAVEEGKTSLDRYTTTVGSRPDFNTYERTPYADGTSAASAVATGLIALRIDEVDGIKDGNFRQSILDWVALHSERDNNGALELRLVRAQDPTPLPASPVLTLTDPPSLPPSTPAPEPDPNQPMIAIKDASLRESADTQARIVGKVLARAVLIPTKVSTNGWYYVTLSANNPLTVFTSFGADRNQAGWIPARLVSVGANIVRNLPEEAPPPLATTVPTLPYPTPTLPPITFEPTQQEWQMPILLPGDTPTLIPTLTPTAIIGVFTGFDKIYNEPNGSVDGYGRAGCQVYILTSRFETDPADSTKQYLWYQVQEICPGWNRVGWIRSNAVAVAINPTNASELATEFHATLPATAVPTATNTPEPPPGPTASSTPVEPPATESAEPPPGPTAPEPLPSPGFSPEPG